MEALEQRYLLAANPWQDGGLAEGEADPQVIFRLTTSDLAGRPIAEIAPGADFFLDVSVEDARPNTTFPGVFAVYLDVTFDPDLVAVVPSVDNPLGFDIEFDPAYRNGRVGDATTGGQLDEVGAFQTGFQPLGSGEKPLFRARFSAGSMTAVDDRFEGITEDSQSNVLDVLANDQLRTGVVRFAGNPADASPGHDVVVYHPPAPVADSATSFVDTDLRVLGSGVGTIVSVSTPSAGGQVQVAPNGSLLIYTPAADFHGQETFTYTVTGGSRANVTVVVDPVNDAPLAVDDAYNVGRNTTLVVSASDGVLSNDSDIDGDPLTTRLVKDPEHGTLVLGADGSFQYTPRADYRGFDRFTYVASDGSAESNQAEVVIEVGAPQVNLRLEVTDLAGDPVEQVPTGSSLLLKAWVQDLRDESHLFRGVFAAYLDVLYDLRQVIPVINDQLPFGFEVTFGPEFQELGSGDVLTAGIVNEIGSFQATFEPLGPDEFLLFEMPFEVTGPMAADDAYDVSYQSITNVLDVLANDEQLVWSTSFEADPADLSPNSDVLLFEPPVVVPTDDVRYAGTAVDVYNGAALVIGKVGPASQGGSVAVAPDGRQIIYTPAAGFSGTEQFTYTVLNSAGGTAQATVTVQVIPSWQNLRNPLDVNSDGHVEPLDALLVINDLNTLGARRLVAPPDGPPFLDVNGDGFVSPVDALLIINFLNKQGKGEGEPGHGVEQLDRGSGSPPLAYGGLFVPLPATPARPPLLTARTAQLAELPGERTPSWPAVLLLPPAATAEETFGHGSGSAVTRPAAPSSLADSQEALAGAHRGRWSDADEVDDD